MNTAPSSAPASRAGAILKWGAIGIVTLLVAIVAAALIFLKTIDPKAYVADASRLVKERTGRDLTVSGAVNLNVSLTPEIVVESVSLANAPGGSRKDLLRLKRLELEIALLPLLTGEVKISRLVLKEPDILLEVDPKGRGNWEFGQKAQAGESAAPQSATPAVRVGALQLEKARLAYLDHRTKKRTELTLAHLKAEARALLASGYELDAAGALNGQAFSVKGNIGDPREAIAGRALALDLVAKIPGLEARLDGEVEQPRSLKGIDANVQLDVTDARAAGAFAGAAVPDFPPLKVEARIRDSGSGRSVDPLRVTLGKSRLEGSIKVEDKEPRDRVTARLAGPLVDLSDLPQRKPRPAPESKGDRVFSAEPLPFATLKSFDLDAELSIGKLVLRGGDPVEKLQVKASLNDGHLKVEPAKFNVAGGGILARLDLDASSGKSAALNLRAEGSGLTLGTLLAMAGHPQQMSGGRTDLKFEAAGSGGSMRALMGSLNGHARMTIGEARIAGRGLDLGAGIFDQAASVLNPGRGENQQLLCGVINVPVRNGIITLDNRVAAETTKVAMTAEGTVNLGTEVLDVSVRSKGKGGVGLADFAGAARVGGTLANPQIGVNARGAAEAAATLSGALATGGMSLLGQSLFSKAFPERPCQDALAARAPAAKPAPEPKKEPGFLERIFGK
jgi:hypothetical protein